MKKLAILTLLTLTTYLSAAVPDRMTIVGTVQEIGPKIVTLRTETGPVKVPRNRLEEPRNVRPGANAIARVSIDELADANH